MGVIQYPGMPNGQRRSVGLPLTGMGLGGTVKYGFAQFASVAFTKNGVDTHGSSNPGHLGNLWPCLRALSQLVDDLATTPAPKS